MPVFNVTVDDTSPLIVYNAGGWGDASHNDVDQADYNNGTFHATDDYGATATLVFQGSAIYVFGAKRSNHDQYLATLDSTTVAYNGFYGGDIFQQVLFTVENLSDVEHRFILENHYTTTEPSWVDVDYILFTSGDGDSQTQSLDTVWDDSSPDIRYTPGWDAVDNISNYYNSTAHRTNSQNASAIVQFHGNSVTLYGGTDADHGLFNVSLDDGIPLTLNGTAPTPRYGVLLYYAGGLSEDQHSLTVTNVDPSENWVDLDRIVVSSWNGTSHTSGVASAPSESLEPVPVQSIDPNPTVTGSQPNSVTSSDRIGSRTHLGEVGRIIVSVISGVVILVIGSIGILYLVGRHRRHRRLV